MAEVNPQPNSENFILHNVDSQSIPKVPTKNKVENDIAKLHSQTHLIYALYKRLYHQPSVSFPPDASTLSLINVIKCSCCNWRVSMICLRDCPNRNNLTVPTSKFDQTKAAKIKKVYKCINCSKAYKSKENLKLHKLNIHLNHKPFKCSQCTRRFSHRNGKLYHQKTFHK